MDSRDLYKNGPKLIDELPPFGFGWYLKRFGVGPNALASLVAAASHELTRKAVWCRVSNISDVLGVNIHPSIYRLEKLGWLERKAFNSRRKSFRAEVDAVVFYVRVTDLGWEYLEYIGVTYDKNHRRRTDDAGQVQGVSAVQPNDD